MNMMARVLIVALVAVNAAIILDGIARAFLDWLGGLRCRQGAAPRPSTVKRPPVRSESTAEPAPADSVPWQNY